MFRAPVPNYVLNLCQTIEHQTRFRSKDLILRNVSFELRYELEICDSEFSLWFWQQAPENQMERLLTLQNVTQYRIQTILQEEAAAAEADLLGEIIGNSAILLGVIGTVNLFLWICHAIRVMAVRSFNILKALAKIVLYLIWFLVLVLPIRICVYIYSFNFWRLLRNLVRAFFWNVIGFTVSLLLLGLSFAQAGLFSMMLSSYLPNFEFAFWGGSSYTLAALSNGLNSSSLASASSTTNAISNVVSLWPVHSFSFILAIVFACSVMINLIGLVNLIPRLWGNLNCCRKRKVREEIAALPVNLFVPLPAASAEQEEA
jgi:hypothetical protein